MNDRNEAIKLALKELGVSGLGKGEAQSGRKSAHIRRKQTLRERKFIRLNR